MQALLRARQPKLEPKRATAESNTAIRVRVIALMRERVARFLPTHEKVVLLYRHALGNGR